MYIREVHKWMYHSIYCNFTTWQHLQFKLSTLIDERKCPVHTIELIQWLLAIGISIHEMWIDLYYWVLISSKFDFRVNKFDGQSIFQFLNFTSNEKKKYCSGISISIPCLVAVELTKPTHGNMATWHGCCRYFKRFPFYPLPPLQPIYNLTE